MFSRIKRKWRETLCNLTIPLGLLGMVYLFIALSITLVGEIDRYHQKVDSAAMDAPPDEEVWESIDYHGSEGFGSTERSSKWTSVRKAHLKRYPECAVCSSKVDLNVHHIQPFHEFPELELDPDNLITLCREHHFNLGHRRNWKDWNPYIKEDAARIRGATYVIP